MVDKCEPLVQPFWRSGATPAGRVARRGHRSRGARGRSSLGVVWVVLVRRAAARRRTRRGPEATSRAVLQAYRKGRWAEVVEATAPALLARPSDGGDKTWRPALELALGHALVETDQPDEAIAHLERGLLLQSALRRARAAATRPSRPTPSSAICSAGPTPRPAHRRRPAGVPAGAGDPGPRRRRSGCGSRPASTPAPPRRRRPRPRGARRGRPPPRPTSTKDPDRRPDAPEARVRRRRRRGRAAPAARP